MQMPLFEGVTPFIYSKARRSTSIENLFIEDVGIDLFPGSSQLKERTTRYSVRCPIHVERTPSFFLFLESNTYHCFGCLDSGGPLLLAGRLLTFPVEYLQWKVRYVPAQDSQRLREALEDEHQRARLSISRRRASMEQFQLVE